MFKPTEQLEAGGHDAVKSGLSLELLVVEDGLSEVVDENELGVGDTVEARRVSIERHRRR